jgi:hypothetical protein
MSSAVISADSLQAEEITCLQQRFTMRQRNGKDDVQRHDQCRQPAQMTCAVCSTVELKE